MFIVYLFNCRSQYYYVQITKLYNAIIKAGLKLTEKLYQIGTILNFSVLVYKTEIQNLDFQEIGSEDLDLIHTLKNK